MKLCRRLLVFILIFSVLISCSSAEVSAKSKKALTKKDFSFTGTDFGFNYNFITCDCIPYGYTNGGKADKGAYYGGDCHLYRKGVDISKKGCIRTKRGIVLGSTYKQVIKLYGKKKLKKVSMKDNYYHFCIDHSEKWAKKIFSKQIKTYVDYTYTDKKRKDTYGLRFYFDKSKKVISIGMYNNLESIVNK